MSDELQQAERRIEFQKFVDGRRAARFAVSESAAAAVEQLLREKGYEQQHHGNSKAVVILGDIDMDVYGSRMTEHGAQPVEDGWFPSALAASRHFGYRHRNAVAQALQAARQRGEDSAVVAGVRVCWADEAHGID